MAIKHYIFFTFSGEGLPIAKKLYDSGEDVLIAQIEKEKMTLTDKELEHYKEPKTKQFKEKDRRRLSLYDGMLPKKPALEVVDMLLAVTDPQTYWLFFDFNHDFRFAEALMSRGFHGLFPTQEDRLLEVDRQKAKDFVQKNYKDVLLAPTQEFKKIEEAINFIEDTEDAWVLKANNDDFKTFVPDTEDPEIGKQMIVNELYRKQDLLEKNGFLLEQRIHNVCELTPEAVFYNGKLLYTNVDIEAKKLGAEETSLMTGCSMDLIVMTAPKAKINKIAFPPVVFEMAKKHEGMFVFDASLLIERDTGKIYFGEFCPNRVGYSSIYTELAKLDDPASYFNDLVAGKNPFRDSMGVFSCSYRFFNLETDEKELPKKDVPIFLKEDTDMKNLWFLDLTMEDEEQKTAGYLLDEFVSTGKGESISLAAQEARRAGNDVGLQGKYARSYKDFISLDYPLSIMSRYKWAKEHNLF